MSLCSSLGQNLKLIWISGLLISRLRTRCSIICQRLIKLVSMNIFIKVLLHGKIAINGISSLFQRLRWYHSKPIFRFLIELQTLINSWVHWTSVNFLNVDILTVTEKLLGCVLGGDVSSFAGNSVALWRFKSSVWVYWN